MSNSVEKLIANTVNYAYNPAAIQSGVLDILDEVSNGTIEVVDPTSPFVFALESAACLVAAAMTKGEAWTRRQYPKLSQSVEDLYIHMADKDYIDRFATPSKVIFSLLLSETEILSKLVTDNDLGIKRLTIPRNTFFTVGNVNFSLQYPIEIRQLAHGGLQIVYDVEKTSPLQVLSSNEVFWEYRSEAGVRYIYIEFPVYQFKINSKTDALTAATGFVTTIPYDDQYYYTRVYHSNADGSWKEIETTHTDQVFDIAKPTAVLRVNEAEKNVTVNIPQVFTVSGVLSRKIRIDVYDTKGAINMLLGDYDVNSFTATWLAVDENEKTAYSAPFPNLAICIPFSQSVATGGSDSLTLSELRTQVINNSTGPSDYPITNVEIDALANKKGFSIIRNVDVVTNRQFLASREFDPPSDATTITGITACIGTVQETMSLMGNLSGVKDNGSRVTICSGALFKNIDGLVSHCTRSEHANLLAMVPDERAPVISSRNYLFNPFHYVLDATTTKFALRAYYLDAPLVKSKTYVGENDTTLLQVATSTYAIDKTDDGYTLTVLTSSDDSFKFISDSDIQVQLGYFPPGESERAYLLGKLIEKTEDGERYYQFKLGTNFDIDSNHSLLFNNFNMFSPGVRVTAAGLSTQFDIFYTTNSDVGSQWEISEIDLLLGTYMLDTDAKAICHEKLNVIFGYNLDNLWKRARTVVTEKTYQKYSTDVPAVYEKDVYEVYPGTNSIFKIENGEVTYNVIHKKGDPIFNADGSQAIRYRAGETMLDGNGLPIEIAGRYVSRNVEILLLDGVYLFATNSLNVSYKEDSIELLNAWIMNELQDIENVLLDRTEIFFYPRKSLGQVSCLIEDGIKRNITAEQSFGVVLYVSSDVYANSVLKKGISDKTISVILKSLSSNRVTVSDMIVALKEAYGSDVIDVSLSGLGGGLNLPALTLIDESARLSIKKKIEALANGELTVLEDVEVTFVRHSV